MKFINAIDGRNSLKKLDCDQEIAVNVKIIFNDKIK